MSPASDSGEKINLQRTPTNEVREELIQAVEDEYGGEIDKSSFTPGKDDIESFPEPGDPFTTCIMVYTTYRFAKAFSDQAGVRLADFFMDHLEKRFGAYDVGRENSENSPPRLQVQINYVEKMEDVEYSVDLDQSEE